MAAISGGYPVNFCTVVGSCIEYLKLACVYNKLVFYTTDVRDSIRDSIAIPVQVAVATWTGIAIESPIKSQSSYIVYKPIKEFGERWMSFDCFFCRNFLQNFPKEAKVCYRCLVSQTTLYTYDLVLSDLSNLGLQWTWNFQVNFLVKFLKIHFIVLISQCCGHIYLKRLDIRIVLKSSLSTHIIFFFLKIFIQPWQIGICVWMNGPSMNVISMTTFIKNVKSKQASSGKRIWSHSH
jgi:hypothetical protein